MNTPQLVVHTEFNPSIPQFSKLKETQKTFQLSFFWADHNIHPTLEYRWGG